jgi:hypothetical protein
VTQPSFLVRLRSSRRLLRSRSGRARENAHWSHTLGVPAPALTTRRQPPAASDAHGLALESEGVARAVRGAPVRVVWRRNVVANVGLLVPAQGSGLTLPACAEHSVPGPPPSGPTGTKLAIWQAPPDPAPEQSRPTLHSAASGAPEASYIESALQCPRARPAPLCPCCSHLSTTPGRPCSPP